MYYDDFKPGDIHIMLKDDRDFFIFRLCISVTYDQGSPQKVKISWYSLTHTLECIYSSWYLREEKLNQDCEFILKLQAYGC